MWDGVDDVIKHANFSKIGLGFPEVEDPEKWHSPLKAFIAMIKRKSHVMELLYISSLGLSYMH